MLDTAGHSASATRVPLDATPSGPPLADMIASQPAGDTRDAATARHDQRATRRSISMQRDHASAPPGLTSAGSAPLPRKPISTDSVDCGTVSMDRNFHTAARAMPANQVAPMPLQPAASDTPPRQFSGWVPSSVRASPKPG
uniref:Uncharacterized protein n=1 Tax=Chlamydomonas euryale TaxID=1486919 RepID=A0A7R9YTK1_9CHLO